MATRELMQPIRVSEMMGITRSGGRKPESEKKYLQPLRVKDLLESNTKSCSRTGERLRKTKFIPPNRKVRRQLYDGSPAQESRYSYHPTASTRQSVYQATSKTSICPPKISEIIKKNTKTQLPRKSLLTQPNTIVNKLIKKQEEQLKSTKKMSIVTEDPAEDNESTLEKQNKSQNEKEIELINVVDVCTPRDMINHQYNLNRPTVIKCVVTEQLRKVENDLDEIKINQKKLESNQDLILSKFQIIENLLVKLCQASSININSTDGNKISNDEDSKTTESKDEASIDNDKKNDSTIKINDNNKENDNSNRRSRSKSINPTGERRRSLRLSMKNDSFSNLEKQLNIQHTKKDDNTNVNENVNQVTPVKMNLRKSSAKSDKPLREYLAMKASMNFLETPDANRFKTLIVDDTPLKQRTLRRSISSKLFDELQDLYHDSSPDSNH
ncbi:hypothetical protein HCN44_004123 [Aphidius gifuensis]|uniref:Uncharacterized protein n=1 Tax=Aphidius gifuensis TaxID=684658 RepID=A0A834Y138_APHGI|nr:putative uncharacterized protein DDB_G0286901 [Aphidius gifuensis]KAF7994651.1 hypothetical protein HCN44_004123 [Aphidius gifuensis]